MSVSPPPGGESGRAPIAETRWNSWPSFVERVRGTGYGNVVLGGTGADRYRAVFIAALGETAVRAEVPGPSAVPVAKLALERFRRGQTDDLGRAVPSYGRPPDITTPKRNRL